MNYTARPKPASGTGGPPRFEEPPVPQSGTRRVARGAFLTMAGEDAANVYLIRRGQVRVFLLSPSGRDTTTALLGPGQIVGIAPLLGYPAYHAFVQAITPVEAWAMPAQRLIEELPRNPTLLVAFGTALARRLALSEGLLRDVALLPVRERVRDALARLEPCLGGEEPHLTRELLGGLVGARRETVSRAAGTERVPAA